MGFTKLFKNVETQYFGSLPNVPGSRFELPQPKPPPPQDGMSTNFTTCALKIVTNIITFYFFQGVFPVNPSENRTSSMNFSFVIMPTSKV